MQKPGKSKGKLGRNKRSKNTTMSNYVRGVIRGEKYLALTKQKPGQLKAA